MSNTQHKSSPDSEVCIGRLALLIYEKNNINRARRRALAAAHRADYERKPEKFAEYYRLKEEGKSKTPLIRALRKKLRVSLRWDDSGYCRAMHVPVDDDLMRVVDTPEINSIAICYAVESSILGEA